MPIHRYSGCTGARTHAPRKCLVTHTCCCVRNREPSGGIGAHRLAELSHIQPYGCPIRMTLSRSSLRRCDHRETISAINAAVRMNAHSVVGEGPVGRSGLTALHCLIRTSKRSSRVCVTPNMYSAFFQNDWTSITQHIRQVTALRDVSRPM